MHLRRLLFVAVLALSPCAGWSAPKHHRPMRMRATAFSTDSHPTSAGTVAHEGIVAADPAILPMGSRIRVTDAGDWSGIYTVTDTGNKVAGMHIDLYIASAAEAKQFGKRIVHVQVLEIGTGKQDARDKDIPASPAKP